MQDGGGEYRDDLAGGVVDRDTEVNNAFGVGACGLFVASFADGLEGSIFALGGEGSEG